MLTDDEIKETKLECVTALKGGADSMASISYSTLYELCDLALRGMGMGGEAVAWRLVGKAGEVIDWASIQRGDTFNSPDGKHHPDHWSTAQGIMAAANKLDKDTAPHRWEPLGVITAPAAAPNEALAKQIRELGASIPCATGGTFENDPPDAIIDAATRLIKGVAAAALGGKS